MEFSFVLPGPAVLGTLRDAAVNTVRSGIAGPMRPDRSVRQIDALRRWGLTLSGALAAAAAIAPNALAVVGDAGTLTYGELSARTHRLAAALADLGLSELDRVGVLCRSHHAGGTGGARRRRGPESRRGPDRCTAAPTTWSGGPARVRPRTRRTSATA